MHKIILLFILTLSIPSFIFGEINAEGIIKIEIGEKQEIDQAYYLSKIRQESRLEKRIRALELAVIQLQNKVFHLEFENDRLRRDKRRPKPPKKKKEFAYYIQTPFSGTHMGKGSTPAEAKANTLKACEKAVMSAPMWCDESLLKSK